MRTADAYGAERADADRDERAPEMDVAQLREQAIDAVERLGPAFLAYRADVVPVVDAVLGVVDEAMAGNSPCVRELAVQRDDRGDPAGAMIGEAFEIPGDEEETRS